MIHIKRLFFLIMILPWITLVSSKAELGVGLGTSGLSVKPFHQYVVFTTFRTGFGAGYSIESFDFALTPELSTNIKLITQESYFLYQRSQHYKNNALHKFHSWYIFQSPHTHIAVPHEILLLREVW